MKPKRLHTGPLAVASEKLSLLLPWLFKKDMYAGVLAETNEECIEAELMRLIEHLTSLTGHLTSLTGEFLHARALYRTGCIPGHLTSLAWASVERLAVQDVRVKPME